MSLCLFTSLGHFWPDSLSCALLAGQYVKNRTLRVVLRFDRAGPHQIQGVIHLFVPPAMAWRVWRRRMGRAMGVTADAWRWRSHGV